ncbi:OmpA family protein [bacterium]|nr:OmpA family protein [bacterium]
MKRHIALITIITLTILISGCSKKNQPGGDAVNGNLSEADLAAGNRWGSGANSGNIPLAEGGSIFEDVHFDFDSSAVSSEYTTKLEQYAAQIKSSPEFTITVEGHCDSRGTNEYNMALGERRAQAVASALVNYGAPSTQLRTVSYGEEIPLAQGASEDAFYQNRRAHFAIEKTNG